MCAMRRGLSSISSILIGAMLGCTPPERVLSHQASLTVTPALAQVLRYPTFLIDARGAEAARQAGLAARQQGDFAVAIAELETAVVLDPFHVPSYVVLGWTQHLAGQRPAAIATLNQGLALDAEHVPALNALGIAYLVDGQIEPAIATHTQAKTLKSDNEIAYYNLSLAYQQLPDLAAAISHAQQATELEPYNPHPWVALALAHWSDQAPTAAQAAYQQALQLDGRYYEAYHLDHLLRAGFSHEQIRQVDEIRLSL